MSRRNSAAVVRRLGPDQVAIYLRVSTGVQEDGYSLETQETENRQYIERELPQAVFRPEHLYREVHTGTMLWERPELERLRTAMKAGEIQHIVIFDPDRFSREPAHIQILWAEAKRYGAQLHFVREKIEDTPNGQLLLYVRTWAARHEHTQFMERSVRGRMARMKQGLPVRGRWSPYGYAWDEEAQNYRIDPTQARVVRMVFTMSAGGASINKIRNHLSEAGVPRPAAEAGKYNDWNQGTISRILRDTRYVGRGFTNKTVRERTPWGTYVSRPRPESEHIPLLNIFEPIIEGAVFDAVQARLTDNRAFSARNSPVAYDCLLRLKYVYCATCGKAMGTRAQRTQALAGDPENTREFRAIYVCRKPKRDGESHHTQIDVDDLDETIWEITRYVMQTPELILEGIRTMLADEDTRGQELVTVDGLLKTKRAELATLVGNAAAMVTSPTPINPLILESVNLRVNQAEAEVAGLEKERKALLAFRSDWQKALENAEELTRMFQEAAHDLETLTDVQERQRLLDALRVRVIVHPHGHEPRWEAGFALDLALPTFRPHTELHTSTCTSAAWRPAGSSAAW